MLRGDIALIDSIFLPPSFFTNFDLKLVYYCLIFETFLKKTNMEMRGCHEKLDFYSMTLDQMFTVLNVN